MNKIDKRFDNIIGESMTASMELTRELETAPPVILGLKLAEECGEFSEALSKELGYLQHKELKEPLMGEAADVINVVLATLVMTYPEKSLNVISQELCLNMALKYTKYKDILENHR